VAGIFPQTPFRLIAHETSHCLDTADLYVNGPALGLTLLDGYSDYFADDQVTVHLDAWHKFVLGWCQATIVELDGDGSTQVGEIRPRSLSGAVILWHPDRREREYFIVERRTPTSQFNVYDSGVAGDGLLIWRIIKANREAATYLSAPDLAPGGNQVWRAGMVTPMLSWADGTSVGVKLAIWPGATATSNLQIVQQPN